MNMELNGVVELSDVDMELVSGGYTTNQPQDVVTNGPVGSPAGALADQSQTFPYTKSYLDNKNVDVGNFGIAIVAPATPPNKVTP